MKFLTAEVSGTIALGKPTLFLNPSAASFYTYMYLRPCIEFLPQNPPKRNGKGGRNFLLGSDLKGPLKGSSTKVEERL
jgi:hypothetical protein